MIQVADNFNYRGKKPNFDRDSFDTLFDFSISSGTSEEPKYCINFADSYSSGIERITIHSNSVQELKDNRDLIDGEHTVEEIWTVSYNNTYIRGVRGGNINLVKFMKISDYAYYLEGAYANITNCSLVKDIVKYIDYEDIPTLNMVANLGGVFIEYIKGKPVISGDMYVSKMGTTQERPANIINKGFQYFDTTINKPIFWDGAKWIDATGATV